MIMPSDLGSLKTIKEEEILLRLVHFNGNRIMVAVSLGISERTLRYALREMGETHEKTQERIKMKRLESTDLHCPIMPSNKYRLKYRDEMLNRDSLFGIPQVNKEDK